MLSWGKIKAKSRSFFQPEIVCNLILLISSQKRGRITPQSLASLKHPHEEDRLQLRQKKVNVRMGKLMGRAGRNMVRMYMYVVFYTVQESKAEKILQ